MQTNTQSPHTGEQVSFAWTATSGYKYYPAYVNLTGSRLIVREHEDDGGKRVQVDLPPEALNELRDALSGHQPEHTVEQVTEAKAILREISDHLSADYLDRIFGPQMKQRIWHFLTTAARQPEAPSQDALREQIARIIDPHCWWDQDKVFPCWDHRCHQARERAFNKADAILALSTPVQDAETVERVARRLYNQSTANDPTIHCNRFPAWEELMDDTREAWRSKALAALQQGASEAHSNG